MLNKNRDAREAILPVDLCDLNSDAAGLDEHLREGGLAVFEVRVPTPAPHTESHVPAMSAQPLNSTTVQQHNV